jgi:hypothetical protein
MLGQNSKKNYYVCISRWSESNSADALSVGFKSQCPLALPPAAGALAGAPSASGTII